MRVGGGAGNRFTENALLKEALTDLKTQTDAMQQIVSNPGFCSFPVPSVLSTSSEERGVKRFRLYSWDRMRTGLLSTTASHARKAKRLKK